MSKEIDVARSCIIVERMPHVLTMDLLFNRLGDHLGTGAVSERLKEAVLKTVVPQGTGGSNPPCSAN